MAKAVEPPPRPRRDVADRAGTLQGQLRALARQTLTHSRSSTSASGGRGEAAEVDATRVTRLQIRALEVLLRMDKDVEVKEPSSAEERAEANSLRLGAALLWMRGKGHGDAADLLEGLHDAFTRRRSAYLPRVPFAVGAGGPHPAPNSDRHDRDGSERPASSSTTATTGSPRLERRRVHDRRARVRRVAAPRAGRDRRDRRSRRRGDERLRASGGDTAGGGFVARNFIRRRRTPVRPRRTGRAHGRGGARGEGGRLAETRPRVGARGDAVAVLRVGASLGSLGRLRKPSGGVERLGGV